jgi:succinyl-CoA synthetase beta subunit
VNFDRGGQEALGMLSTQGGMDIEEVAERDPQAIDPHPMSTR